MGFEKGNPYAVKKGEVRNPNGRPRKFMTAILKDQAYKADEVSRSINAMLTCTPAELKKIIEEPTATTLEIIVAKSFLNSIKKGSPYNLLSLLERSIGKAKETVEVTHQGPVKVIWNLRAKPTNNE
jgi:hypothetical protein